MDIKILEQIKEEIRIFSVYYIAGLTIIFYVIISFKVALSSFSFEFINL